MSFECPVELPAPLTYEQNLAHSQGLRMLVANALVAPGIPTDKDGVELLLKVLKDKDHTALAERKNTIEADGLNSSKDVVEAMALLVKQQANKNPFMRRADGSIGEPVETAHIPHADPEKLGHYEVVEGEMEIGIIQENADEFMARMARTHDEAED